MDLHLYSAFSSTVLFQAYVYMWQGLPHINIVKQHEMVESFKVSLFI